MRRAPGRRGAAMLLVATLLVALTPAATAHKEPNKYWKFDPALWEHGWKKHWKLRKRHDRWHDSHPNAGKWRHRRFHHRKLVHGHFEIHHHEVLKKQEGTASWYQGEVGACGSNLKGYYAAHPKWKCGQLASVRYKGKHVFVRIKDRGPHVDGRIVDLSKKAFKELADPSVGLIDVKLYKLED